MGHVRPMHVCLCECVCVCVPMSPIRLCTDSGGDSWRWHALPIPVRECACMCVCVCVQIHTIHLANNVRPTRIRRCFYWYRQTHTHTHSRLIGLIERLMAQSVVAPMSWHMSHCGHICACNACMPYYVTFECVQRPRKRKIVVPDAIRSWSIDHLEVYALKQAYILNEWRNGNREMDDVDEKRALIDEPLFHDLLWEGTFFYYY